MEEKPQGPPMQVAGTMSGTSLDGVDAAVVLTDGVSISGFGQKFYRPYDDAEQDILRRALGCWPDEPGVQEAAELVEFAHRTLLGPMKAELIGFHGQTLAHAPGDRDGRVPATHQAGDGARLARALERPVAWDFRSADVAAGGQGAPLAPAYHFALARYLGLTEPVAFLNLGGVANLTWVDPAAPAPFAQGAMVAFDAGPANAPLNDLMHARFGEAFDEHGAVAAKGQAHEDRLQEFLAHPFFEQKPPKSLDRDAFPVLAEAVEPLSDGDAAATLVEAVAISVERGLAHCPRPPARVIVCGGGRHHPVLMARLATRLPCPVQPVEDNGLDGDMIEAQAFAFLAVRSLHGLPLTGPGTTGVARPMTGGRISRPGD